MNPIITSTKPDISTLPGGWEPKFTKMRVTKNLGDDEPEEIHPFPGAMIIKNILTPEACKKLIALMETSPNFESVSVQGNKDHLDARIGSKRTTMWSPELAEAFWLMFKNHLLPRHMENDTLTDWWQDNPTKLDWEPVAVSPMLRFMKYEAGGQHYAHYDAGFIYPDKDYRTLQSIVIYLTTNSTGATRFVKDGQSGPIWNRKHDDWIRETNEDEILYRSYPVAGNVLIFDHRICHDVEKYLGAEGPRIIIRGDVVYKAR
jgi:hypothetical protein